jgi:hypothetical protein
MDVLHAFWGEFGKRRRWHYNSIVGEPVSPNDKRRSLREEEE